MSKTVPIRIVIDMASPADPGPILSYIIIDNGRVIYIEADETPKPLAHLVAARACDLRFALEDVKGEALALKIVKRLAGSHISVTPWKLT